MENTLLIDLSLPIQPVEHYAHEQRWMLVGHLHRVDIFSKRCLQSVQTEGNLMLIC